MYGTTLHFHALPLGPLPLVAVCGMQGVVNMEKVPILGMQWLHSREFKRGHSWKMCCSPFTRQNSKKFKENNLSFTLSCIVWGRLVFVVIVHESWSPCLRSFQSGVHRWPDGSWQHHHEWCSQHWADDIRELQSHGMWVTTAILPFLLTGRCWIIHAPCPRQ